MSIDVLYTAEALSTKDGRNGHVRSSDGLLDAAVAVPKELGGNGGATNPEQMFAAGYAACFHAAVRHLAGIAKMRLGDDTSVAARVGMGPDAAGGYGLELALTIHLPGLEQAEAEKLVEKAYQTCPYSNATRSNVETVLTTTV